MPVLLNFLGAFTAVRRRLSEPRAAAPALGGRSDRRILFISGEAATPEHADRVARYAAAAVEAGFRTAVVGLDDLRPNVASGLRRAFAALGGQPPDLAILWRAAWCNALRTAVRRLRTAGARIAFDVDDHVLDPAAATREIVAGILGQSSAAETAADLCGRLHHAFMKCDAGIAPTEPLAGFMRRSGKPSYVLPDGFDPETYATSRRAVLARRREPADGLVRIGYVAGPGSRPQDFGLAAGAVARVLAESPWCRLVLVQAGPDAPRVDAGEFPELVGVLDRIECRSLQTRRELPRERARFDVNLAPLETGHPICEATSERQFFEAALVDVCTVASPTRPFAAAIRQGTTGMLASGADAWHAALRTLVDDPGRRRAMARAALLDVLWRHGPDGRRQAVASVYRRLVGAPDVRAREFAFSASCSERSMGVPRIPETEELFRHESGELPDVSVVVPCYNYARFVTDALDSVARQSLSGLELIIVDDGSTDDSAEVVGAWLRRHGGGFVRALHLKNRVNSGLSLARNAGFAAAEAPLVFPLDADNELTPTCLATLRDALLASDAAAAHPSLVRFGDDTRRLPAWPWDPDRFRNGNFIDAMALIRRSAWSRVGGYEPMPLGWEDYDFWCLFVEAGLWSLAIPEAAARYRVHGTSMLHAVTDVRRNRAALKEILQARHPWLDIPLPAAS